MAATICRGRRLGDWPRWPCSACRSRDRESGAAPYRACHPGSLNRSVVHKRVTAAGSIRDEAIALGLVEEFNCTGSRF